MKDAQREIRTPQKQLLMGLLRTENGRLVLAVQSRGKSDIIDINMLLNIIYEFLNITEEKSDSNIA